MSNAELEDWITYFQEEKERLEQGDRKQQSTTDQLAVCNAFVAEAQAEANLKKKVRNGNNKSTNR